MPTVSKKNGPEELAEQLIQDIRRRRLGVDDPYYTDAEASRMLGVSTTMAHRAMRVLADQQVIKRRGRAGTFISADFGGKTRSRIRTAYVLMRAEWEEMGYQAYASIISGIRSSLPETNVQFSFVPVVDPGRYTRELIASAKAQGEAVGFVAMSCRRAVYLELAESGMPTIVSGMLYPGVPTLPSLDNDPKTAGHLLARHLLDRGHRQLLLVYSMEMRPGNNALFDGISEELTKAKLPHNSLLLRCVPNDSRGFTATVAEALARDVHPTGVICPGLFAADMVTEAIAGLNSKAVNKIEVAAVAASVDDLEKPRPYWYARIKADKEERAGLLGQMLARVAQGEILEPHEQRITMPLMLVEPA
ncbi:LacI family DNA-binding transcriptional regulator [Adhaeretor mobilis]|uniref:HTH gntR-type domain-containing protein n=1 Tax=Adhaeretor mobilis TaxID=1930276 RepID=A0A517MW71_9BACT|nr:GntR family transcriptional regulator [Adhaeretor mobilis]QDS99131.1 hypothetical protein HG15A2_24230 [Adhaeretor mobilis]